MRKKPVVGLLAVVAWFLGMGITSHAFADQIVLKNGRVLTGEVSGETDRTVTLEVSGPGITFTQRVDKAPIKSWDRPARTGPWRMPKKSETPERRKRGSVSRPARPPSSPAAKPLEWKPNNSSSDKSSCWRACHISKSS